MEHHAKRVLERPKGSGRMSVSEVRNSGCQLIALKIKRKYL